MAAVGAVVATIGFIATHWGAVLIGIGGGLVAACLFTGLHHWLGKRFAHLREGTPEYTQRQLDLHNGHED